MSESSADGFPAPVPLKRLKASRACDQCRKLRTRCDEAPLPSSGGLELGNVLERRCKRCLRLNIDCTFILPIGETRDRPKKMDSPIDTKDGGDLSPSAGGVSKVAALRKITSVGSPSNISEPLEQFKYFLDHSLPIVTSKEISHNTSVLLTCCVRLLVGAFTEPSNTVPQEQIWSSIKMYFVQKQALTTPGMHNVQSLLLLSLLVDEPGAGNKFLTAVRMACALHWNHPSLPHADRSPVVSYLWWTMVSQDIWLYIYTGVPPLMTYGSFNVPRPSSPSFFNRLTTLSEVLRLLVRSESVGEYVNHSTPEVALKNWEEKHLGDTYAPSTPGSSIGGVSLDSQTLLQMLHSAVIAMFILNDPYFLTTYSSRSSQSTVTTPPPPMPVTSVPTFSPQPGSEYSYMASPPSYMVPASTQTNVVGFLLSTVQIHLQNTALFGRLAYLSRISEICVVAMLRLDVLDAQAASAANTGLVAQQQIEERSRMLVGWRELAGEARWARAAALAEKVTGGWQVVFDLNDEVLNREITAARI